MSTIQAAQQAVVNAVSATGAQFSVGIASDVNGEYIQVYFQAWPATMNVLSTNVGGYRVKYDLMGEVKAL